SEKGQCLLRIDVNGMPTKSKLQTNPAESPCPAFLGDAVRDGRFSWVCSKRQAERKLHDARIARKRRDFACRAAAEVVAWLSKLPVLVRLNTSQRNCSPTDSWIGKSRIKAKSKTFVCGPRSVLRPTLPRNPGLCSW